MRSRPKINTQVSPEREKASLNPVQPKAWPQQKWFWALLIVAAVIMAYHNSLSGPFIFDDLDSVLRNPTIRDLSRPAEVLSPPRGALTVSGRPLLNLSFAINYAINGVSEKGYHIFNLAIHLLASLTLFGITRRTLLQPVLRERFGAAALPLAAAIATLWAVHPLQTGSVTYIVQRAESLMGLFYLGTIYCVIRATNSRDRIWPVLAIVGCACGMATKEVMASAPVMALLYDRTFVSGTFRQALRQRWPLYLSLAGTWILLGWLVATGGQSGGARSAGVWGDYALTQFFAIVHYLRLTVWPHPLVLDYGPLSFGEIANQLPFCIVVVTVLVVATLLSLRLWPVFGFTGFWFFAILAPSSGLFPLDDPVFEHRMYLPLAAIIAILTLLVYSKVRRWRFLIFGMALVVFVVLSAQRNTDYQSNLAIWTDTVTKRPNNARAHCSLGLALRREGQTEEALWHYEQALRLNPNYPDTYNNYGAALLSLERFEEAIPLLEKSIRLNPRDPSPRNNLGVAYYRLGRLDDAITQFEESLRLNPHNERVRSNLASMLEEKRELEASPR